MTESFPRQEARTRRFTLGAARTFRVSPDGARVVYLRSKGGADPVTCLWVMDVASGRERLVADPRELGAAEEDLPPEERARRERVRESAGGVVAYATDAKVTMAVFTLSGHVYLADLTDAGLPPRPVPARTPALDPRPDPTGHRLAYVSAGALRVTGLDASESAGDRAVADPQGAADVTYGLPEFIAAEEMHRRRGYWWSPDGSALLVARVDETPVNRWHIADPAHPEREPVRVAYPAAGTPNADVSLFLFGLGSGLDGGSMPVDTDAGAFPYLVTARWQKGRDPLVVVQSRDQRTMRLLRVDPGSGRTEVLHTDTDPHWLEIVTGVPAWTADGRIVWTRDDDDTRRLVVAPPGGEFVPVTPPGLQVRAVLDVDGDAVLFQASAEPTEIQLWSYSPDGLSRVGAGEGIEGGTGAGGTTVVVHHGPDHDGGLVRVYRDGAPGAEIASFAESPALPAPRPVLLSAGSRQIRTAVLFPSWHEPGREKLPVLVDPYGGPGAQRVMKARGVYLTPQWFAEQGFAVVIADGRGTPARGPGWEHAVAGDLADPVLEDQVDALHAAAGQFPDLDTDRVAIRGWSFGGYLAALAVLRRPDVFHAAVAGAPVTDWHLYDTHYTERYLGHPDRDEACYERSSLLNLPERAVVSGPRPLLLIHGLADDNVVVAHTLRLSSALLAAGYPHQVLPLSGITHMASQETVAENMLLLQLDFLRGALGLSPRD